MMQNQGRGYNQVPTDTRRDFDTGVGHFDMTPGVTLYTGEGEMMV